MSATDTFGNGIPYWGRDLSRRIQKLEDLKPDVVADRVQLLANDVRSLRRAFYTFALSVVGSSVVFAFSVFALLGKHP